MSPHPRILPMKAAGVRNFIDRIYRESGTFQWVRESVINSLESSACHIEFGIEWQAVDQRGVYRRMIADDGCGMDAGEIVEFFNTFGGGGKPIGGPHQNFGVGAKTSLLPWNNYGLVVISWKNGEGSLIWVQQDPETGEYGLRLFEAEDPDTHEITLTAVVQPFEDEEHGCDWSMVKPEWLTDHGTVLVLLGNAAIDDTVRGDPAREEADIKGISTYLNRRLWEIQTAVVHVEELRTSDRGNWPRSDAEAHGPAQPGYDRRVNRRQIMGAAHYIVYGDRSFKGGELAASGSQVLFDGTTVDWYLWEGKRPAVQSYAAISGYIAALYDNELFDVTAHPATYRAFGITEAAVRTNCWFIVKPPLLGTDGSPGVYPRTDRNSLLLRGGPRAGEPLPLTDWGADFSEQMPEALRAALRKARSSSDPESITDPAWRDRLAERFGALWRIAKLRVRPVGASTVTPTSGATASGPAKPRPAVVRPARSGTTGGTRGEPTIGTHPGLKPAIAAKVGGGIPYFRAVSAEDIGEPGMMAVWQPNHPDHPEGVVLINKEHPVLLGEIERYQNMYADHLADEIREDVLNVYGTIAVAKVAHSEYLKGIIAAERIDSEFRTPSALTMALLGIIAEEAVISTRIGGKYGRKRVGSAGAK